MNISSFADLGIHGVFADALKHAQFVTPTQIQAKAIPLVLDGKDVLGIAQTGTGKTAAFGLPVLQRLQYGDDPARPGHPRVLILAPTRELAAQIDTQLKRFGADSRLRFACIFGGVNQHGQVKQLNKGVDVLTATPGRLLDLMQQGFVSLNEVKCLILDEADRLLDLGFARDIERIAMAVPKRRQTLLFSATMPGAVTRLAQSLLYKPERIDVSPKAITVDKITQRVAFVPTKQKQFALRWLLAQKSVSKAIVFTRTKHGANRVAKKLNASGVVAEAIHGNKSQNARTRALENFLAGDAWVLVATDIAARGIDISGISHVINFDLPQDAESYVHRIGRTGRAGASGSAFSLVDAGEKDKLRAIEKLVRLRIEETEIDFSDFESSEVEATAETKTRSEEQTRADKPRRKRRRPRRRRAKAA